MGWIERCPPRLPHKTYLLTHYTDDTIVGEKTEKYNDFDIYQSSFLECKSKHFSKKPKKLSNASDDVKSYFDSEAIESVNYITNYDNED